MKVGIISDIHDNIINLDKCLKWCKSSNVKSLICCGDITNNQTLSKMSDKFLGDIFLVRGNADNFEDSDLKKYKNINYLGRVGQIELGSKKIGLCHEPFLIDKVLEMGDCDYIFYGHTHKPWEEKKDNTRIINPGTLGGMFQKATFAVLDLENNNLELKILELLGSG